MIEFIKFQGKLSFSHFCSRMISFCQQWWPAWGVSSCDLIPTCCVTWSELFLGETIGYTFDLPMIVKHFSQSSVCCMLSQANFKYWSVYREWNDREFNSEVLYVKFLFGATLFIPGIHVSLHRFLFCTELVCFANYATFSEFVLKITCLTKKLECTLYMYSIAWLLTLAMAKLQADDELCIDHLYLFTSFVPTHTVHNSGLLILCNGAISHNQPQIASDRTIHERTHKIHKIKHINPQVS